MSCNVSCNRLLRSCSIAYCFQQDHCQHAIRSAMALLAGPWKPPRMEMLQLFWAVFPAVLPFGKCVFSDIQTKSSNIQFVDHLSLCNIWHWKKAAPKTNPNKIKKKKNNPNSITSVALFQIVVVAIGLPHSILFTRLNKLRVSHLFPCRPCALVPNFNFSTSLQR